MTRVLIAETIAPDGIAYLRSRPGIEVDARSGSDLADLSARLQSCDALIVRSATRVNESLLAGAPRLKVIGRAGIGVDNIDVGAATERGIVVLNTPDANATTTAELTVAHLLSLSRHLPQADRSVRATEWKRTQFMGTEVAGKIIGIIGFGAIGRVVASRCLGLKMRVIAYDPLVTREVMLHEGVAAVALQELLEQSDYVSLHCPLNDKTRGLINAERLARMRIGTRLINCARGGLVDEAALLEALDKGKLAGAALDVFEREPPLGSPLIEHPKIVLTPHLGASTAEAQIAAGLAIAKQVAQFLETGEAINAVNLPRIPAEDLKRLHPYLALARRLGRVLAALTSQPLTRVEVTLRGRAAELDSRPLSSELLVGLLECELSIPVNRVNACHLAHRQGISLVESRSEDTEEYVSLITAAGHYNGGSTSVAGTLIGDRPPRLVRIDDYEVETVLDGTLLITRHEDRPGVIGALGTLLGQDNVNISRMQVGIAQGPEAIAVIGISRPLPQATCDRIAQLLAIHRVYQVSL